MSFRSKICDDVQSLAAHLEAEGHLKPADRLLTILDNPVTDQIILLLNVELERLKGNSAISKPLKKDAGSIQNTLQPYVHANDGFYKSIDEFALNLPIEWREKLRIAQIEGATSTEILLKIRYLLDQILHQKIIAGQQDLEVQLKSLLSDIQGYLGDGII
jgi:hypothetical protein